MPHFQDVVAKQIAEETIQAEMQELGSLHQAWCECQMDELIRIEMERWYQRLSAAAQAKEQNSEDYSEFDLIGMAA